MTETNDEIIEHLAHIRSALDDLRQDMRELKRPVGALENRYVDMSGQLDRINFRIERIERRLDLTDA
jgi:predicted  nucleic acid-binding Zn-ribbon protein